MNSGTPTPAPRKRKIDLVHLHHLTAVEPATSTGRVVWIWPEIEASLAAGKMLHEIWEATRRDGLNIPYAQFRVYVSRIRRRKLRGNPQGPGTATQASGGKAASGSTASDPFRNIRTEREKQETNGFSYDPSPKDGNLI